MSRTNIVTQKTYELQRRTERISPDKEFMVLMYKGELTENAKRFIQDRPAEVTAIVNIGVGFVPPMRLKEIYRDQDCVIKVHDKRKRFFDEIE